MKVLSAYTLIHPHGERLAACITDMCKATLKGALSNKTRMAGIGVQG